MTARSRWVLGATVALAALLAMPSASAEEAPLAASGPIDVSVSCEHKPAKGRVLCDVEIEISEGRIAWADVVVVEAPPFAPPLRSRVQMGDARTRADRRLRIPVAFVATAQGKGTVVLRARTVLCRPNGEAETCVPAQREARAELTVGTDVVR